MLKPISDRIRARKRAINNARMLEHKSYKKSIAISNTVMATRLPYDSNSTSNYSRFAVDTRSRVKLEMTENEIIDLVLHGGKHHHNKTNLRNYDLTCVAPEVTEYWRNRVSQSELKRGRMYKKLTE